MAFQMSISLNSGINIEAAYVKITSISGNKEKICCFLNAYVDRNSMISGFPIIEGYSFFGEFTPALGQNVGDFITQAYLYLKTLPEFVESLDVLEEQEE